MVYGGSQGTSQIVASSFFFLLAAVTVFLRLLVRVGNLKTYGVDDGFICAALLFSAVHLALIVFQVLHGQGQADGIPYEQLLLLKRALYTSVPIYCCGLTFAKLAILFLYLRFFQGKALRWITIGLVVFVSAWGCAAVLTTILLCSPMKSFWDRRVPGKCLDRVFVWFMNAAVSLGTDIIILILPMPILYGLNLPKRQRFELMGVFAFGSVACIISIFRLHALYIISTSHNSARDNGSAAVWSSVEVNIGIVCASLPILRSSFVKVMHSLRDRWQSSCFVNIVHSLRNRWRSSSCGTNTAAVEMGHSPNDADSGDSGGIMRSITTTITATDNNPGEARRRTSFVPFEKVWDGEGASSWIAIERWKSDTSNV